MKLGFLSPKNLCPNYAESLKESEQGVQVYLLEDILERLESSPIGECL